MTADTDRSPEDQADIDRMLAEVTTISDQLAETDGLLEDRLALYRRLRAAGVPNKVIGDAARVTAEAVRQAIHKANRAEAGDPITRRNAPAST